MTKPDVIVLFSGGLDSLLTARLLMAQGLAVRCLHCYSPFFGSPEALPHWQELYGLDLDCLDVSEDFSHLLLQRPVHGFGKVMNPCVDCKILLLRRAKAYMEAVGAHSLATGEVLGQRPMSQRRDTLHVILRDAGVTDILLRPLCARLLAPTRAEREGRIDRSQLLAISGRGRSEQMALAARWGLKEIPTPGGGCRLTERENARRYWPVLRWRAPAGPEGVDCITRDFALANLGRQFWHGQGPEALWLCVGRNSSDNEKLAAAARPGDYLLTLADMPGPLSLAREGTRWPGHLLEQAAALTASYAPRAVRTGGPVRLLAQDGNTSLEVYAVPRRPGQSAPMAEPAAQPCNGACGQEPVETGPEPWGEPSWEEVRGQIRAEQRLRLHANQPAAASFHGSQGSSAARDVD